MENQYTGLLKKFLENRCSPSELKQVRELLERPENRQLLDNLIEEQAAADWEATGYAGEDLQPVMEQWKKQLNERIYSQQGGRIKMLWPRRLRSVAAVAAGIVFFGVIAFWALKNSVTDPIYMVQQNTDGLPVKYLLPDSSKVYLAAGSQIRYRQDFSGDTREVILEGEAFFDVIPDPKKAFIICTGNIQTKVLGTSFRVTAYKGLFLEVAVASGKVQVTDNKKNVSKKTTLVTKGNKLTYDPVNGAVVLGTTNPASLLKWTKGEVFFEDQQLDRITEELHRIYGAQFRFEQPGLKTSRVSSAFSATEPLGNVMEMLAFVGKFRYRYDGEKKLYTIYQKK